MPIDCLLAIFPSDILDKDPGLKESAKEFNELFKNEPELCAGLALT